jgi:hypothetical protein
LLEIPAIALQQNYIGRIATKALPYLSNILTALRLFSHHQQAKAYGGQMNGC